MGIRGTSRTPRSVLKKRDSWLAKTRPPEPRPAPGAPDMPEWLPPFAQEIWRHVVPALDSVGILSKVDLIALARYCQGVAQWREAIEVINDPKRGPTWPIYDRLGHPIGYKDRPEVKRAIRLSEMLGPLERKFGLTPSDRANFAANNPEKMGDPNERFFYNPLRVVRDDAEPEKEGQTE